MVGKKDKHLDFLLPSATSVHKIEANISDNISRRPIKRTPCHLRVCHPSSCERVSRGTECLQSGNQTTCHEVVSRCRSHCQHAPSSLHLQQHFHHCQLCSADVPIPHTYTPASTLHINNSNNSINFEHVGPHF